MKRDARGPIPRLGRVAQWALVLLVGFGATNGASGAPPEDPVLLVERAFDRGGPAAVTAVAAEIDGTAWFHDEPESVADVWLVADELASRGKEGAARALAEKAPLGHGTEALVGALLRDRPAGDPKARTALAEAEARLSRGGEGAKDLPEALARLDVPRGTLLDVRRALLRARALVAAGRGAEASEALEGAAEIGRTLEWPWARWVLGRRSVVLALDARDPIGALRRAQRLQEVPEAQETPARLADVLSQVGAAAMDAGRFDLSEEAFRKALAYGESAAEDDLGVAAVVELNYATALQRMGRFARAHERFESCEQRLAGILEEVAEIGGEAAAARWAVSLADAQNGFGAFWFEVGQPGNALACYRRAEAGFRRALAAEAAYGGKAGIERRSVLIGLGMTIANQAEVHAAEGEIDRAREATREAIRLFDEVREAEYALQTLAFLAEGEAGASRPAEAAATWAEMLQRARAVSSVAGEAQARLGAAQARLALARARTDLLDRGTGGAGRRSTLARWALDAEARGARQDLLEAQALASQAGGPGLSAQILATTADACLLAGEAQEALTAASNAVRSVEDATAGLEASDDVAARVRAKYAAAYVHGARASLALGVLDRAVWFLEASRAQSLLRALGGARAVGDAAVPKGLRERVVEAQAERARARSAYEEALRLPPPEGRRRAGPAREEAERTAAACKELEERLRTFEGRVSDVGRLATTPLKDLRRRLDPGDVFVWYATLGDEVAAIVADPAGERAVSLGRLEPIARACEALRDAVGGPEWRARADEVGRLVLTPLGLSEGVQRLLVSPQGPIAWVPWRAVVANGHAGLDVALVPSSAVYARLRADPPRTGHGVLALGGCDYGARYDRHAIAVHRRGRPFDPLPASGPEAQAVAPRPEDQVLLGPQATLPGLRARLDEPHGRRRAVHFACHGVVHDTDPMLSALALTATTGDDGLLRASEILGLSIDADLATLSACETGLDREIPGEGYFGLTRAFMAAGVPRVLACLWKADDEATAYLMKAFYARYRDGMGAARALREAQVETAAAHGARWAHPTYWAGWVVWGLPD